MMNNDLTSSSVDTQRETSRGTKRPHPSPSSQARMPDCPAPSYAEAEGRSPRRMRMSESPTDSYGGCLAGLNILVTEIQNTAAPRPQESPAPPQSHPQPRTLPLSPQRRRQQRQPQQQQQRHQCSPPLRVHRPGKRTVYVQDVVFRLLVMSQLETKL